MHDHWRDWSGSDMSKFHSIGMRHAMNSGWPKRKRKFRFRPRYKWGPPPPGLEPHPKSKAYERHQIPPAFSHAAFDSFSDRKLKRTENILSRRGGCAGRFIGRLLYKLRKKKRPPDIPKTYTVDFK